MHLSSLPGDFGCGDMGSQAGRFADFLHDAGFSMWQMLPITPVNPVMGNSPYSGSSAFAGNFLLISPDGLADDGLLLSEDISPFRQESGQKADFDRAAVIKSALLRKAWDNFKRGCPGSEKLREEFDDFRGRKKHWLEDYALFCALKERFPALCWNQWPREYRMRDNAAVELFLSEEKNADEAMFASFVQFIFFRQWEHLHKLCSIRGIDITGDLPIYVSLDSSDVWADQNLFDLDEEGRPRFVAGVPPDCFSETGQRWGNPLYRWDIMEDDSFSWWMKRIEGALDTFDAVRIDHFRGFCGYWSIPACDDTAENGEWKPAPGRKLFQTLKQKMGAAPLPLIAEDLGVITDDVRALMKDFDLPGMKILLFAFENGCCGNQYAPYNHSCRDAAYTGTHDNNTVSGWWEEDAPQNERRLFSDYVGREIGQRDAALEMIRLVLASPAWLAVIPVQDLLGLGGWARMNLPGTKSGSWEWRLDPCGMDALCSKTDEFKKMNRIYGRTAAH